MQFSLVWFSGVQVFLDRASLKRAIQAFDLKTFGGEAIVYPPPLLPPPFVDLGLGTSNSRGKGAELAVGVANAYLCVRMWSICVRLCTSVCIYVHTLHIYPIYMHTAVHNRTHVHHALHTGMHLATPNIEYISTFKYPLCAHTYPRQNLALATPNIN